MPFRTHGKNAVPSVQMILDTVLYSTREREIKKHSSPFPPSKSRSGERRRTKMRKKKVSIIQVGKKEKNGVLVCRGLCAYQGNEI